MVLLDSTSDRKQMDDGTATISPLAGIIAEEIRGSPEGAIPFVRFMELALYHPQHGYYHRSQPIIGKKGDFFTSVSVGPLFGQLLAYFLIGELEEPITLVEAGANDGSLAKDILAAAGDREVSYCIVEPSAALQTKQRATLKDFTNVSWRDSLEAVAPVRGAIFSNELLDAFPCHRVQWAKARKTWLEIGVTVSGGTFQFAPLQHRTVDPPEALTELEAYLPDGYIVELSPGAERWWREAAGKLERGALLAIDYGDEQHSLWTPSRPNGTLRAYRSHQLVDDPLADPGEQDLTAHVNFTALIQAGEAAGLKTERFESQERFLTKLAGSFFAENPPLPAQARQLQMLANPALLGHSFKVLVQRRIG